MKYKSGIIKFIAETSNNLEKAYRYSIFSKLCCKAANIWDNSVFGKAISGFFDMEVHKNSLFFKAFHTALDSFTKKLVDMIPLKEAVNDSKYIRIIKNAMGFKVNKKNYGKAILDNSFFISSIYRFWISTD